MVTARTAAATMKKLSRRTRIIDHNGRTIHCSTRARAAQNFTMPAMSPTMTEGNIASWKVKEGDNFSTGDVLLEIETDKAQMDVEAQDDGKLAKLVQQAGAKGVKVGARIAVIADQADDLATLELPSTDVLNQSSANSEQDNDFNCSKQNRSEDLTSSSAPNGAPSLPPGKSKYPLYPSIVQILHENGLSVSEVEKIHPTGPKGRLLKGDVLGHIGKIGASYSKEQSQRISRIGRLDLSNITPAQKKSALPETSQSQKREPVRGENVEGETKSAIAVPISLSSVLSVQRKIKESLGIALPLSTFIARATELANSDLPSKPSRRISEDDLFSAIVGIDKVSSSPSNHGKFMPQVTSSTAEMPTRRTSSKTTHEDIYDVLGASKEVTMPRTHFPPRSSSVPSPVETNIFSVTTTKGEARRARIFLERMKTLLQVEPGRLIL